MNAKKPAMPVAPITKLNAAHKASQGWQMRVQGYTWDAIAQATGYHDGGTAYRAVKNYFGQVPVIDHEMQRQIARERTEFLQRKALEQVDASPSPANIRAAVETLRRAAALDGLDSAMKVAVEASSDEIRAWAERMIQLAGAKMPDEADIFSDEYAYGSPVAEIVAGPGDDGEPVGEDWYARTPQPNDTGEGSEF